MAELPTGEIYGYRVHVVPHEMHAYKKLRSDIRHNGILEPVTIITDGHHVALEEGHKRVEAAMELGLPSVPVTIVKKNFGPKRRYKWPIREGMAALLAPEPPEKRAPAKKAAKRAPRKAVAN